MAYYQRKYCDCCGCYYYYTGAIDEGCVCPVCALKECECTGRDCHIIYET